MTDSELTWREDPEKRRAYGREYSRKWRQENKEKAADYRREYLKDPARREKAREASRRWRERNKERMAAEAKARYQRDSHKFFARNLVSRKVVNGHWPPARFFTCSRCELRADVYHHPDYDQPLLVEPLCNSCHMLDHRCAASNS